MKFFRSLFRKKISETQYPFSLTSEQIEQLKDLQDSPGWVIFTQVVVDLSQIHGEAFLGTNSIEDFHYRRGLILGLRQALSIINQIVEETRRLDGRPTASIRKSGRITAAVAGPFAKS